MILRVVLVFAVILALSCKETGSPQKENAKPEVQEKKVFVEGAVSVDNTFKGARLNDFKKLDDSTYQALILPEHTPVNNSPWYAFRIWSKVETKIKLEIAYAEKHQNRYLPKLSRDGITWEAYDQKRYQMDSISGKLTIDLNLSPDKLWVAAQENLNSDAINTWMDSLATKPFMLKTQIGKSVLGQSLNLLQIREGTPRRSVVLIGRQHPPEVPGGTLSLMAFVQEMASESDLAKKFRKNFEILVFPLVNPDGVDNGNWRYNANGKDLNRDWVLFSQPETKAIKDWVLDAKANATSSPYCFGIDFHTSHSGPYLLTLDTIPDKVKPKITSKWIDKIQFETKEIMDIRPRKQTLPYCYNWMINELGVEAVTYEEGDEIDREIVKKRARDYAIFLMEVLLEEYH